MFQLQNVKKKNAGPETSPVQNHCSRLMIKTENKIETYQISTFRNCKEAEMHEVSFQERVYQQAEQSMAECVGALPSGGVKKLKKESLGTVLVTVLTVPRPLCFCFFLMVFNVTFLPLVQLIVQLKDIGEDTVTLTIGSDKRQRPVG